MIQVRKVDDSTIWESVLKISEKAQVAQSIDDFVKTIHDIISEIILARNFYICLYDESLDQYYFPYFVDEFDTIDTIGIGYSFDKSSGAKLYDLKGTVTDYVRKNGEVISLPDKEVDELLKSGELKLRGKESLSWLGVPLIIKGDAIGVMVVQSYDIENAFSKEDEILMIFISDHITKAIESVRAEEEIKKQFQLAVQQRDLLEFQRQAITESINYASKIQTAILPSQKYMDQVLPEHFVLFKPKEIVSGDFYWIHQIMNFTIIAVADCTGHGIPGAFMSMLGIAFLNEIVIRSRIKSAGEYLNQLRLKVRETLMQEGMEEEPKDGMDIALAIIDNDNLHLQFAGAHNPLFIIRNKHYSNEKTNIKLISEVSEKHVLFEIKGDGQPIAISDSENDFTNSNFQLMSGDSIYLFTDGYADQKGGAEGKKYLTKRFRKLLLDIQNEPMSAQKNILDDTIEDWKGETEQIDDILVFGGRW